MKNRNILSIIIFFLTLTHSNSEVLNLTAKEIIATDNGNIITAIGESKFVEPNKIIINADKFIYNKKLSLLKGIGNVVAVDLANEVTVNADFAVYNRLEDKLNTIGKTSAIIGNSYFIESSDVLFDKDKNELSSKKFSKANDNIGNKYIFDNFIYNNNTNLLKGSNIEYRDNEENIYRLSEAIINIKNKKILGKDADVKFRKDLFDNKKNDPRLKGTSFKSSNNLSTVKNGVFTSCHQNDKCPPWVITSKEATHDKSKKIINYKNAWLKVYDIPVLYFPKFFHPDPTVKRQSGYLTPRFSNSETLGRSFTLPYFYVIDDNSDLTFTPRIFSSEKYLFQTEYRKINNNINHQMDIGFNKGHATLTNTKNNSRSHIYSNTVIDFDALNFNKNSLELNVEKISNDTYLDLFAVKSPLIKNTSSLNSYVKYLGNLDNTDFNVSFHSYEVPGLNNSDKYEYVYPNFNINNNLNFLSSFFDSSSINTYGHQKKFQTNVYEGVLINDLNLGNEHLLLQGFENNTSVIIKNVNSKGKNSSKYKSKQQSEMLGLLSYNITYPLQKLSENMSLLTPKMTFMYSPNETKNLKNEDRQMNINNIFSTNRIGANDAIEGGSSMTLGAEYKMINKDYNDILNFDIATVFKDKRDEKLPLNSTLGKKTSDVVGSIILKPNDLFNLNYDFSLDNNLKDVNYTYMEPKMMINNFVVSFEFLEESNLMGGESYLSNKLGYTFNENNSLNFRTRKNKKTNLREFYNLIYEYQNDCLIANIRYDKKYYSNNDLKPEENLMFTITIIPIGSTQTKNILPE